MLSTDTNILEIGSAAYIRMREYAGLVAELHIVILCGKKSGIEIHDTNLHVYPTNSEKKLQRVFDAYKIVARTIAARGTEMLISCQDPFELGLIGVFLKKKFGTKLKLQIHTDFENKFFINESIKNRIRNFIARRILKYADGVRVVSERIKKTIVTRVPTEKISVLPIFVDVAAIVTTDAIDLHSRFPQFKKIILMASRLTHEKQIAWACNVLAPIIKNHTDVGIIILGDGPERTMLEKFSFVRTLGWMPDVVPHIKGADIFLNTSLYEGYGRTIVEAAAAGTPIITTDVGVAPEIVRDGENGLIIPVGDGAALCVAVERILMGGVCVQEILPQLPSKSAYLTDYLRGWEKCFI